jgi:hypothetical protein
MFSFSCPGCKAELKAKNPPPEGKKIRCKQCDTAFVPKVKELASTNAPATPTVEEEDANPYGVMKEEDTEAQIEAKKKVRFDGVTDKKKRSARGPAMSLLVMPSNILVAWGSLLFLLGLGVIVWGGWPLVFSELSPSDDDYAERVPWMLFGLMTCIWGSLICLGTSRMQNLESYTWAVTAAVMGILPGIFALVVLRNPKVIAGFQEVDGAMDDEEEEEEEEEEGDEDDEEDEDEDD